MPCTSFRDKPTKRDRKRTRHVSTSLRSETALALLILFFIPGVNLLAPFIWGLFSAWCLALEYTEYPFGNSGISFREQRQHVKNRRMTALGFGGGIMLFMLIPGLNFLAMPAAVTGATALWVERFRADALAREI